MPKSAAYILVVVLVGAAAVSRWTMRGSDHSTVLAESAFYPGDQAPAANSDGILVYFSPHGGCEEAIVEQIEHATRTIDVQAYVFTSPAIAQALGDAQERGVRVRAIIDKNASVERGNKTSYLAGRGVATYTDGQYPIAHNKIIIVDGRTVLTGSFNFTRQAENANAENLIILLNRPTIAQAYEENFERHLSHSVAYVGR